MMRAAAPPRAPFTPGAVGREILARRDALRRHLAPVAFEFFGDELGEAGERALPHLGARDANDASIVRLDRDPEIDLSGALGRAFGIGRTERQAQAERQTAAGDCRRTDDEAAARKFELFFQNRT